MRCLLTLIFALLLHGSLLAAPAAAPAGTPVVNPECPDVVNTGVVPRFVTIKPSKANLRTGPGDQYPITWVYVRAGLPVEIIREYCIWRQIRDADGTIGWINKSMLIGERHAIVTRSIRTLYEGADLQARPVWRIEPGAIVTVVLCEGAWCRITRDGKGGYIPRNQLWGVYPDEAISG